jgi:hypothetical protein
MVRGLCPHPGTPSRAASNIPTDQMKPISSGPGVCTLDYYASCLRRYFCMRLWRRRNNYSARRIGTTRREGNVLITKGRDYSPTRPRPRGLALLSALLLAFGAARCGAPDSGAVERDNARADSRNTERPLPSGRPDRPDSRRGSRCPETGGCTWTMVLSITRRVSPPVTARACSRLSACSVASSSCTPRVSAPRRCSAARR